ncbi:hypothetical protein [Hyphomicrobium sp. MC8b]|uniref:hypothetical protein n=1 Tax=Hyphomicrobium sp. MC8b TaxID=300273 RepID=UPI003919F21E
MWILNLIAKGGLWVIGKIGLSGLLKTGLSFTFPGWGTLLSMLIGGIQTAAAFVWEQLSKAIADCVKNPRVGIIIGIALVAGNWYGWNNGHKQGEGDLETYRQEAVVYQQQADATAAAAKAAKEKAEAAELAKIAAEKKASSATSELAEAKATAEANAKALADAKAATAKSKRTRSTRAKKTVDPWSAWVTQIKKAFGT